jgi:hypothetical protein
MLAGLSSTPGQAVGHARAVLKQANGEAAHSSTERDRFREARRSWAETVSNTPIADHQEYILGDFVCADADRDGVISIDEYHALAASRAENVFEAQTELPGIETDGREELTAFALADRAQQFERADRDHDAGLSFHEVYFYETFDRPGVFPTASESVPQVVSGRWEQLTVKEHPNISHDAPFSPQVHEDVLESGGFATVDKNGDGFVSIFEASDYSLLTWDAAAHAFDDADVNDDALLTEPEYHEFESAVAAADLQAKRPGELPSGRQ